VALAAVALIAALIVVFFASNVSGLAGRQRGVLCSTAATSP
jgi:hypothetical protein